MADKFMTTNSGKGKELCDLLRKELKLPDAVTAFSVHFELNEVVRVDCTYLVKESRDG